MCSKTHNKNNSENNNIMSKSLSTVERLKLIYKTNRFPWKRHVMVGWDLTGNEYWEMPNPNNPSTYIYASKE